MEKKKKCLVVAEFAAPYRVAVFDGLAKEYDLLVFFDSSINENRNEDWFIKKTNFPSYTLGVCESELLFTNTLNNLSKFDFVLVYNARRKSGRKTIRACVRNNIPFFINNDGAFLNNNFIKTLIKKMYFKHATAYLAGGQSSVEYFKKYGNGKEIVVHNFSSIKQSDILSKPLNENSMNALKKKYQLSEKPVILSIGQFIYRKGFDLLLNKWTLDLDSKYQLVIIGGGNEKNAYLDIIQKNNFRNVVLIDYLPKDIIHDYYMMSDVFIFPTRQDIWGLVINEAMSYGLPVISSNKCNSAKELIIDGENGFLVDFEQNIDLDNLIYSLKSRRNQIFEISTKIISDYTIEGIIKSHIETISRLIK